MESEAACAFEENQKSVASFFGGWAILSMGDFVRTGFWPQEFYFVVTFFSRPAIWRNKILFLLINGLCSQRRVLQCKGRLRNLNL